MPVAPEGSAGGSNEGEADVPLSTDPDKRARQLANLRRENLVPGQGADAAHRALTTHGAYSERLVADVSAEVREIMEALADAAPVRAADGGLPSHDVVAVELAARQLRRLRAVETYLDLHGVLDEKGNVRPATDLGNQLAAGLLRMLADLGMTPASRAKLGVDLARTADLAADLAALARSEEANGG